MSEAFRVLIAFLKLGLTSFGGPIAHLGYFRREFVQSRKWLTDESFSELLALCQFLPGPASSQLGLAIGYQRAGVLGSFAAWLGFTAPSALLMIAVATWLPTSALNGSSIWLHGLKLVAVAVVADAVLSLGQKFCRDVKTVLIAAGSLSLNLFFPSPLTQVIALSVSAGLAIALFAPSTERIPSYEEKKATNVRFALVNLALFLVLLVGLPLAAKTSNSNALSVFDGFYRAGALVFGGGHVVLPLLETEVLSRGLMSSDTFMSGYGAVQAVPGPLFTFAAYLGAVSSKAPNGVLGGLLALIAIFSPSILLVFGALPFWDRLKSVAKLRAALIGLNAAVVGLLTAAFVHPVWSSAIFGLKDLLIAGLLFSSLRFLRAPPILVVIAGAALAYLR